MSAVPYPMPDEPPGCGLPGEQGGSGCDEEGIQQGLYAILRAEELTLEDSPRMARLTP
jgi:hypothetical protein